MYNDSKDYLVFKYLLDVKPSVIIVMAKHRVLGFSVAT
jgi:hypothetical protein